MAVSRDMFRTWRHPRLVMRELLAMGRREDRALAFLMAGCAITFVAQWPRLQREAFMTGEDFTQLMSYDLLAWIFMWPLVLYGIAAIAHLVAKLFRGKGTFYSARLSLFWTLLSTTPIMLFYGLLTGLNGNVAATQIVGALWLVAFVVIWIATLIEAEKDGADV
ncbi:hypothetical protein QQG91_07030 [Marivivens sp. LCG002]|uniref:hypothetical protein n=1 Tax=Marivivens sp. LCG002 TaxID=3051171 RepID=UPI0025524C29|nr:hypothetical protein [Marivivens sp. LCG002]WIV52185.1 hypothetical protein QQG91_07030 [Marivivens sp. LCG002]